MGYTRGGVNRPSDGASSFPRSEAGPTDRGRPQAPRGADQRSVHNEVRELRRREPNPDPRRAEKSRHDGSSSSRMQVRTAAHCDAHREGPSACVESTPTILLDAFGNRVYARSGCGSAWWATDDPWKPGTAENLRELRKAHWIWPDGERYEVRASDEIAFEQNEAPGGEGWHPTSAADSELRRVGMSAVGAQMIRPVPRSAAIAGAGRSRSVTKDDLSRRLTDTELVGLKAAAAGHARPFVREG